MKYENENQKLQVLNLCISKLSSSIKILQLIVCLKYLLQDLIQLINSMI